MAVRSSYIILQTRTSNRKIVKPGAPGFLKLFLCRRLYVCVLVCLCVCVRPQGY